MIATEEFLFVQLKLKCRSMPLHLHPISFSLVFITAVKTFSSLSFNLWISPRQGFGITSWMRWRFLTERNRGGHQDMNWRRAIALFPHPNGGNRESKHVFLTFLKLLCTSGFHKNDGHWYIEGHGDVKCVIPDRKIFHLKNCLKLNKIPI